MLANTRACEGWFDEGPARTGCVDALGRPRNTGLGMPVLLFDCEPQIGVLDEDPSFSMSSSLSSSSSESDSSTIAMRVGCQRTAGVIEPTIEYQLIPGRVVQPGPGEGAWRRDGA